MFSLVIPTYNERENIVVLIPRILAVLRPVTEFEIIVVDDDSPDKTWEIVQEIAKKEKEVRLIRRFKEKDLSSAVMAGFESARGDLLGVMDGDLQHDEALLPQFIEGLREAPIVVASRYLTEGGMGQRSWWRTIISKVAGCLPFYFLDIKLSDPLSGYFAIHREILTAAGTRLNPRGFKIFLEILCRSPEVIVKEIPLQFRSRIRGSSKLNARIGLEYLLSFYDLFLGKVMPIQFLKFCIVGFIGVIINLFTFFLLSSNEVVSQNHALVLSIAISMIGNYFMNNYWTFGKHRFMSGKQLVYGFLQFFFICFLGLFINFSCAVVLHEKIGIGIYAANLVGIGIAVFWNFRWSENLIWKTHG